MFIVPSLTQFLECFVAIKDRLYRRICNDVELHVLYIANLDFDDLTVATLAQPIS